MKKWHKILIVVSLLITIAAIIIFIDDRKLVINILSLFITAIIVWIANTYTASRKFDKLVKPLRKSNSHFRSGFLASSVKGTDIIYRLETKEHTWIPGSKNFININIIYPLPDINAEEIFNDIKNNFNKWSYRIKGNERMTFYCELGFNKMFFSVRIIIPLRLATEKLLLDIDKKLISLISGYHLYGIYRYIKYIIDESENYIQYTEYTDNHITRTITIDNGIFLN